MDDLIVSGWLETTAGDGTRWCRALPAPKPSHTIQGEFVPAPTTSMRRVGVLKGVRWVHCGGRSLSPSRARACECISPPPLYPSLGQMRGFGAPRREPVFESKAIPVLANFGVAEGWSRPSSCAPRVYTRSSEDQ